MSVGQFPSQIHGDPPLYHKLLKLAFHPLIDKMADRLLAWKGNLMNWSGHLALIKTTLSAISIYTAISLKLQPWVINAMNCNMKGFLWMGRDMVQGGKCIVAWSRVQPPLDLGRLGIIDLRLFGRAM
jgi:hypothetical protein